MASNIEDDIVKAVHMQGHVGEDNNIKTVARIASSRLVINCYPESKNVKLQGPPGVGKDSLCKRIMSVLFPPKWKHLDLVTKTAIDYSQTGDNKDDDFGDFVLYLEDVDHDTLNSKNFRTMLSSEERKGTVTKDQEALDINYRKPTIIMTLGEDVESNPHLLRRLYTIELDDSEHLNREVINRQWDDFDKIPNGFPKEEEFITNLRLRTIKLKKVLVQCPKEIIKYIKNKALPDVMNDAIVKTLNQRLIDFIKFSAALNQENRIVKGKDSCKIGNKRIYYDIIEATMEDANNAIKMFECYKLGDEKSKWTALEPRQIKIYKCLQNHKGESFTAKEINDLPESSGVCLATTYNDLKKIVEKASVKSETSTIEGNKVVKYSHPGVIKVKPVGKSDVDYEF